MNKTSTYYDNIPLKPCPFCGGKAKRNMQWRKTSPCSLGCEYDAPHDWFHGAYYTECGANTGCSPQSHKDPEAAIKEWNRRYSPARKQET